MAPPSSQDEALSRYSASGDALSSLLHRLFSSYRQWELLFVAVFGLIAVASLAAEHRSRVHGLQKLLLLGSSAQVQ